MKGILHNAKAHSVASFMRARNAKPRILAILHLPPPAHGTTLINCNVVESAFITDGYSLTVMPIHFSRTMEEIGHFEWRKIWLGTKLFLTVLLELIRRRPDLVYMTPAVTSWAVCRDMVTVRLLKLFRRRILLHLHGMGIDQQARNPLKRLMYRDFFHHTSVVCLSPSLREDIARVYRGKPYIVPNGIRSEGNTKPLLRGERPLSPVRFLFLSNLSEGKGIYEFLDALKRIKERGRTMFHARIVGAPKTVSAEELRKQIRARSLDSEVEYMGSLYGPDKEREWEWADLFVFPTKIDVFGLVLLEAMQHRLPIVASRMAAIPDVVQDGETGLLVEPGNVLELADCLERLACEPERRRSMGGKGYERYMAHFTVQHFERNLKAVFDDVLRLP